MKHIISYCFATLIFCIAIYTQNLQAQQQNLLCAPDTTCNSPYILDTLQVTSSKLCDSCYYRMFYYWRICDNPLRIDFQLNGGVVGDPITGEYPCADCIDWKELWKEGVRKVIMELATKVPDTSFKMTFSNEACWKKIDGAGPGIVAGYIVEPCNTECCKYTYQVHNGIVNLIQYEAPLSDCPPGDECFALCDPYGYFPNPKRSTNELLKYLEVFPNPVKSNLNIQLNNLEKGKYEIRVSNLSGQTVIFTEQQNQSETMDINLSVEKLNKGPYFFTIVYDNRIIKSGKFIVE